MNILQLISSFNDEISVRAIAAYSKVLKNNNHKSYVFAPLGRELSYFKRWGAEIVSEQSSSSEITFSRATIKEIAQIISLKAIVAIHVYDMNSYKAALQLKKLCSVQIIMSLLKNPSDGTMLSRINKTLFGEPIPQATTLVPSQATYKELLTKYTRKNVDLFYVPVPIDFTIYDEKKISEERTISLATRWGMLEKPRHIIFTKAFFGSPKWQNQLIKLSMKLENLPENIKPYIVVLKNNTNKKLLAEFEEKFFKNRNSVLCLMDAISDIEAGLKLSSIYLELSPKNDYYSINMLNAMSMGNTVVSWKNSVTKEIVPLDYHSCLADKGDINALTRILTDVLKMSEHTRNFTGRTCRNYVINNFNIKNIEELLMNAYSTLSFKKAS